MTKLAIDVVLLPSDEMMDRAIEINRTLLRENEPNIKLHVEKCLPHISLCMGCIEETDLPALKHRLEKISTEFSSFHLQVKEVETEITPSGKTVSVLGIKKQDDLQQLHETVMNELWDFLSYDVDTSMLFNPPEVEEETLYWISNYANHYEDPSLFSPHITIGFGEIARLPTSIPFKALRIAMCHLGNNCTCRKVILSFDLK
jgi:2'-5' RNA ligase